jgi:hypothetical protein
VDYSSREFTYKENNLGLSATLRAGKQAIRMHFRGFHSQYQDHCFISINETIEEYPSGPKDNIIDSPHATVIEIQEGTPPAIFPRAAMLGNNLPISSFTIFCSPLPS